MKEHTFSVGSEGQPINRKWSSHPWDRAKEGHCKRCDKLALKVDDGTYLCDECKGELREMGV